MRKIDKNTHPPKGTRSGKQLFFPYPSVFAKSYVRCDCWRDANNYLFYKIIHFSVQFSAVLNILIVKTYLNSIFTNNLKRKENFSKNVQNYRLCSFKELKK